MQIFKDGHIDVLITVLTSLKSVRNFKVGNKMFQHFKLILLPIYETVFNIPSITFLYCISQCSCEVKKNLLEIGY